MILISGVCIIKLSDKTELGGDILKERVGALASKFTLTNKLSDRSTDRLRRNKLKQIVQFLVCIVTEFNIGTAYTLLAFDKKFDGLCVDIRNTSVDLICSSELRECITHHLLCKVGMSIEIKHLKQGILT